MVLRHLRTRAVLVAAVPVLAIGVVGAGALTSARAAEPRATKPARPSAEQLSELSKKLHDRHAGQLQRNRKGLLATEAAASVLGDFDGDGKADVVTRDHAGRLWVYAGKASHTQPITTRQPLGTGWNAYNGLVRHGDFNNDGRQDVFARDTTGRLWFYPGARTSLGARVRLGQGWNGYTRLLGGSDLTGDGLSDLIAIDTLGKMWLYAGTGNGTSPLGARRQIGSGWNIYRSVTSAGDLSGDGGTELVAADRSGKLWEYVSTGNPAVPYTQREPEFLVDWWNFVNITAGVGDLDGRGFPDLVVRFTDGYLALLPSEAAPNEPIWESPGWNIYNLVF